MTSSSSSLCHLPDAHSTHAQRLATDDHQTRVTISSEVKQTCTILGAGLGATSNGVGWKARAKNIANCSNSRIRSKSHRIASISHRRSIGECWKSVGVAPGRRREHWRKVGGSRKLAVRVWTTLERDSRQQPPEQIQQHQTNVRIGWEVQFASLMRPVWLPGLTGWFLPLLPFFSIISAISAPFGLNVLDSASPSPPIPRGQTSRPCRGEINQTRREVNEVNSGSRATPNKRRRTGQAQWILTARRENNPLERFGKHREAEHNTGTTESRSGRATSPESAVTDSRSESRSWALLGESQHSKFGSTNRSVQLWGPLLLGEYNKADTSSPRIHAWYHSIDVRDVAETTKPKVDYCG